MTKVSLLWSMVLDAGRKWLISYDKSGKKLVVEDTTLGSEPSQVLQFPFETEDKQPTWDECVKTEAVLEPDAHDKECTIVVRQYLRDHRGEYNMADFYFPKPKWRVNSLFTAWPHLGLVTVRDRLRDAIILTMVKALVKLGLKDYANSVASMWIVDHSHPVPFMPRLYRYANVDTPLMQTEGLQEEVLKQRKEVITNEWLTCLYDDKMIHPIPLSKKSSLGFSKKVNELGEDPKVTRFKEHKGHRKLLKLGVSVRQVPVNTVKNTLADKLRILASGIADKVFNYKLSEFDKYLKEGRTDEATGEDIVRDLSEGGFEAVGRTAYRENDWSPALRYDTKQEVTGQDILDGIKSEELTIKDREANEETEDMKIRVGTILSHIVQLLHCSCVKNTVASVIKRIRQITGFDHAKNFVPEATFISQVSHRIDISQVGYPTTSKDFLRRVEAIKSATVGKKAEVAVVDRTNCDHQFTQLARNLYKVYPTLWEKWCRRFGYVILPSDFGAWVLGLSLTSGHFDTAENNSIWGRESVVEILCYCMDLPLTHPFAQWFRKKVSQIRMEALDHMDEHGNATEVLLGFVKWKFKGFEYWYPVIDGKDDQILYVYSDAGAPDILSKLNNKEAEQWKEQHKLKIKVLKEGEEELSFGFVVTTQGMRESEALTINRLPYHEKIHWGLAMCRKLVERIRMLPQGVQQAIIDLSRTLGIPNPLELDVGTEYNSAVELGEMDNSLFEDEWDKISRSDPELQSKLMGHVPESIQIRYLNQWRKLFKEHSPDQFVDPRTYVLDEIFNVA